MNEFQKQVGEWADRTFPQSNNGTITEHLRREVIELTESNEPVEAADCFLILLHHAHKNGYDLLSEAKDKFHTVQSREWGNPDAMGVVEHVRGTAGSEGYNRMLSDPQKYSQMDE